MAIDGLLCVIRMKISRKGGKAKTKRPPKPLNFNSLRSLHFFYLALRENQVMNENELSHEIIGLALEPHKNHIVPFFIPLRKGKIRFF